MDGLVCRWGFLMHTVENGADKCAGETGLLEMVHRK